MKALNALIARSVVALVAIILATSLSLTPINAESPPFKVYTTQEGLAHDSVNKIVRDSRGFLWFCTAEGLSRFDGTSFTSFTTEQGLPHRNINDFLETSDGIYLVATSAGLAVFDPNGRPYRWNIVESRLEVVGDDPPLFRTFVPETDDRQRKIILSLAEDSHHNIWAGTALGLYRLILSENGWRFEEFKTEQDKSDGVAVLFKDSKGNLLIGRGSSVYQVNPDGEISKLLNRGTASVMEDRDGNLWLDSGGTPVGLQVFAEENGALRLLRTYTKKDGLPDNSFFFAIEQMADGRIFVGMHDGLCEFMPDAANGDPKFRRLEKNKVTALAEDAGGSLWIGTELFGAWKLAPGNFTIFGKEDGFIEEDDIRSIYPGPDGDVYVPTRPHKTLFFRNGKFQSVTPFKLAKRSWSWHFLDLLSKDQEWWIPTEHGLYRYPRLTKFEDIENAAPKNIYSITTGLPGEEIFNMFEDSRGDIWFTIVGVKHSLLRWQRSSNSIIATNDDDGLPMYNGPISFAEDRQGDVWFGHYFGGLSRYRKGRYAVFGEQNGLPQGQIGDLLIDSSGRLWIATSGRGLLRIDDTAVDTPEFKSISTADGLSSNQIICLTEDRFGRIYAGTGRGIDRINANGTIDTFTQADGLPSNYITRCAADKNGRLWFVSRNTLVRFAPEIDKPTLPPQVYVDKISAAGVQQKISALGESNVVLPDLAPNQGQIQVSFFALTFGAGENIRYQYRLDDQDWSSTTTQQTLNFDVSPDKHHLEIRAVIADGLASEKPAALSFRILPPIWQRWWFVLGIAVLVFGAIFLLHKYRTARLREVNAALEDARSAEERLSRSREERIIELEKVRTRIATDLHDDIGASLTQIAVLSEVAQSVTTGNGGSRDPLRKISEVSNELVGTMSDIVWSINPAKDHLSDLIQRMRRFAADLLSARAIGFQFGAPPQGDEIVLNTSVRREMFLVFKESINNVTKHSGARNVIIRLDFTDSNLVLTVADDGIGFDTTTTVSSINGGNGLLSMHRRACDLSGRLNIESIIDRGTTVTLVLPLNKQAVS